jgi:hypothetical protein
MIVIVSGCATTTHVQTDLKFTSKQAKLSKTVLLEIPQQTRDYVAEKKYAWQAFRIPIGQAVEPNALAAFSSIIEKVTLEKGGESPYRLIELSITPETGIRLGAFTFSKNTFKITLKCDVKTPDGKAIWSTIATAESSKRKAAGALGGVFGYSAYTTALQEAANAALKQALQKITDDLYKAKRKAF